MHKFTVEKPKAKFRVKIGKEIRWVSSQNSANELAGPGVEIEKQLGKYKATCTLPSGKKDIRWLHSFTAISQFAAEYGISADTIKWIQMR